MIGYYAINLLPNEIAQGSSLNNRFEVTVPRHKYFMMKIRLCAYGSHIIYARALKFKKIYLKK